MGQVPIWPEFLTGGLIPGGYLLGHILVQRRQAGHFRIQSAILFAQALFHQCGPIIHLRLVRSIPVDSLLDGVVDVDGHRRDQDALLALRDGVLDQVDLTLVVALLLAGADGELDARLLGSPL